MPLLNLISQFCGNLARVRIPKSLRRAALGAYASIYGVEIAEASNAISDYPSLADFFVRELRPECRPFTPDGLGSPVDGVLRGAGAIQAGMLECIKGRDYTLMQFLGDREIAQPFREGLYLNFYLSPRDCHHVFAPIDLRVQQVRHIPGGLWPVNDWGLRVCPAVLAQNERVVVLAECSYGPIVLVMVGALNVGSIELSFTKLRTNLETKQFAPMDYRGKNPLVLARGQKLGTFHLGSSVVILLSDAKLAAAVKPSAGSRVKFGERML
ncbi:MAG: archaetidylserine decarboxylase [Oligoflexia bacterium]|nr:archaetidylserine decarboxylase [Oligoflexia bacterium]